MSTPRPGVAIAVLALGLASCLEACLTVEWWSPGCYDPSRWGGPVAAAYGAPLPYARFAYSSLTYFVMPHVVVLDVVLLASVIGAPMLVLAGGRRELRARWMSALALSVGLTLLRLRLAWWGLMLCAGFYVPVMSIGESVHHRYGELRPAGLTTHWHSYCEQ